MFSIDIDIARAPADVFAYLADVASTPDWYSAVQRVEKVGGASHGRGGRYRFWRQLPGGPADNEVEITEFEPDKVFTLRSVSGPTPFTYRYLLSPAAGGTRLRLEGEITGEGLGGPLALFAPFASRLFERGMRTNLGTLKRLLERG
jgi:uncharacterized protein YndB with AHSA1/START domain